MIDTTLVSDGGRKYTIALLVVVCTMLSAAMGWIHESAIVTLLISVLGLYGLVNAAQAVGLALTTTSPTKPKEPS